MRPVRSMLHIALLCSVAAAPLPALAQTTIEGRVTRLEKEIRAVQRKVFPGGAGMTVEPEITQPASAPSPPGTPATSPIADVQARLSAVEAQLRSLTAQVEQGSFKVRELEAAVARLQSAQASAAASPAAPAAISATAPVPAPAATAPVRPAGTAARAVQSRPTSAASSPTEARTVAVAAVERPSTGDAPGDAYTYGFRLWDAKFYPEAQIQLKEAVDKYGSTSVGSRAHNLLGRAYLDDGKPALASVAFYENYQKRPKGDRAADSLAYLGEALIQLKKPADACKVYQELEEVYGADLRQELRTMIQQGRTRAKCSG